MTKANFGLVGDRLWCLHDDGAKAVLDYSDDGGKTWMDAGVEGKRSDQMFFDARTQLLHIGTPEAIARALDQEPLQ